MSSKKIAEVVVALPVAGPFHYKIPLHMRTRISTGVRVWVPFQNRVKVGYVVGLLNRSTIKHLKNIKKLIDSEPILSPEMLELTRWVADYYYCSWGEAIEAAIPGPLKQGKTKIRPRKSKSSASHPKASQKVDSLSSVVSFDGLDEGGRVFLLSGASYEERAGFYLEATAHTLSQGKSIIILVPEIVDTTRMAALFSARFGKEVAIFHSRLSSSEKFYQWHRIKQGKIKVVVGTRSAVFLPAKDLGLIVVDEEQQISYKEDQAPRYNGRDVAIERARRSSAAVILGASVPSLESYYNARKKHYESIDLAERAKPCLSKVRVVDMREEPRVKKTRRIFSRALEEAIRNRLIAGEKVVLFLNRRGFATFISCKGCGFVIRCKSCRVSLIYHFYKKKLICRYCNYQQDPPEVCPECKKRYLSYLGIGTQKVESEAARLFLGAAISRIDPDVAGNKDSHKKVLRDIREGKLDILVGTQMVTSAFQIPNASLVGVVLADQLINLPDFRASERVVQLLSQLSGIVEGAGSKGEIIIQSYNPTHYNTLAVAVHNFDAFFKEELTMRKELSYPPYRHLVNITLRGKQEEKVADCARALVKRLKKAKPKGVTILGQAPFLIPRLRGSFRWHLLLRGKEVGPINNLLRRVLPDFKVPSRVILTVNVDPMMLL